MKKEQKWFYRCPGMAYAANFYPRAGNQSEARAALREEMNVKRLPKGTEVWKS